MQLGNDVVITGNFEIRQQHRLGIIVGGLAILAQLFRRPQPDELAAAGKNAKTHFLVVGELGFKDFLAIVERGHVMLLPGGYPTPNR